uniref:Uncharacterized protein n=1 Tax=Salix viminalis TaxID=40686 RepID=A0A6N2KA01_SALVM
MAGKSKCCANDCSLNCYKIYNVASLVLLNAIISEFPFMHPSFGVLALVLCLSQELLAKRFLGSFLVFMDTEDRILYINDEGVIPEALSCVLTLTFAMFRGLHMPSPFSPRHCGGGFLTFRRHLLPFSNPLARSRSSTTESEPYAHTAYTQVKEPTRGLEQRQVHHDVIWGGGFWKQSECISRADPNVIPYMLQRRER